MCLDRVHLGGAEARVGEGGADDTLLRGAVGCGEAVAGTVLVDGRTPKHRKDPVAVAPGPGQPLQEDQADPLGEARTVGRGREGLGAAVRGGRALAGELDERAGRRHHRHPAGQGQVAFALPQRLGRQMHRHQ
ncbi:hypothetical protein GCM10017557_10940 [Streptomyces aurantiacus]|uniref:Uncharacterized protein n=1 Tax=Streptomyces aurantiacus TaxID=47760 RepID=A0A7G1NZD6_9ACTN|nr:hypothetical protein GCM10017557_10940 [Streptomyces aurantiacus]